MVSFHVSNHVLIELGGKGVYLFKPGVEIHGSHEHHPRIHCDNDSHQFGTKPPSILVTAHSRRHLGLNTRTLDRSIPQVDIAQLIQLGRPPRHDPTRLHHEHERPLRHQEHMSRDIMAATPTTAGFLTRRSSQVLLGARNALLDLEVRHLTLPARPAKAAINQRRAKEPLRDDEPPGRDGHPATEGALHLAARDAGVCRHEHEERKGDPGPALLDKVDVEGVALSRKVEGLKTRLGGDLGLRNRVVRHVYRRGVGLGEHATRHEEDGDRVQRRALHVGRQKRGPPLWWWRGLLLGGFGCHGCR